MPDSSGPEALFVRLYLDRHIKPQLAVDLRARGFDARTTQEAGLDTAADEEQLAHASREGRALLTFNIRDFAPLHDQWLATGSHHAGVVVSQPLGSRQYAFLLARTLRLLDAFTSDEMRDNLVHREQFK